MRRGLHFLLAAVVIVSALAWRRRGVEKRIEDEASEVDRFVDMGVTLTVVELDREHALAMERTGAWLPDLPPVRALGVHHLGGMLDTWANNGAGEIVGPSINPRQWQCSPRQEALILHDDGPVWALVQGSEGGNKTTTGAMWLFVRTLEFVGNHTAEIGVTAPTNPRLSHVQKAIAKFWDPKWYQRKERDNTYKMRSGPLIQLVSAHQQSEDAGSPIQGANWFACLSDELQDHHDRNDDIVSRGRSAPGGIYKRLCTSTFKDSTEWRNFKDKTAKSKKWSFASLIGPDSPFIWPSWWETIREGGITDREWKRRVLALDVGPEAQLYHCFRRKLDDGSPGNLRPIPLGAVDVTAEVLAPYAAAGERLTLLVGHDPGKRQHVSEFIKAFRVPGRDTRPRWFVVDEVTTPDATIEAHIVEVIARGRDRWHVNMLDRKGQPDVSSGRMIVRADPHTRSGDEHPGADTYAAWRARGVKIRAAAYKTNSSEPGVIKRESRFDMMNTLFCDVNDVRRLFIACDDMGTAAAPMLLKAVESMERDGNSKGEAEKKNESDLSHWPASVGYALWQIEHPRASDSRVV